MTNSSTPAQTTVVTGRGAYGQIASLIAGSRPFVVATETALSRTHADQWLPDNTHVYSGFQPNPTTGQAMEAASELAAAGTDLVIGLGGGSAMDVAKAARALPAPAEDGDLPQPLPQAQRRLRLVLIPTTAGTGSEVTRFATLYKDGRKTSLDAEGVQADLSVVDPALTDTCPAPLTWSCAFDALAHSVESLWSVHSTRRSRLYAHAALSQLAPVLAEAGDIPTAEERDVISEASLLAGRAINITRTTAAHALAYPLTSHAGVAHGLACALNLTWLAPLVEDSDAGTVVDPRGHDAVRQAVASICDGLGIRHSIGPAVSRLLCRRNLGPGLPPSARMASPDMIVNEGLASNRMSGTPVRLDRAQLLECTRAMLSRPAVRESG